MSSASMPKPEIPQNLQVPTGKAFLLRALGRGVQIYTSQPTPNAPGTFQWVLKGPDAFLTCEDERGQFVATHYAGPTWQSTIEGDHSKVVGEVLAKADSPDPGNIPWLLLKAKSTEGNGLFGTVGFIQRLLTRGGLPPSEPASQANSGSEVRVTYQAEYVFYSR